MFLQYKSCISFFSRTILSELNRHATVWVAGGAVRDYFSTGRITSDIDLFFPAQADRDACFNYLVHSEIETVQELVDDAQVEHTIPKERASVVFENENVTRLKYKGRLYDLVSRYFPGPAESIEAFDFTVSCGAVDQREVYTHPTFFIDLAKRQLMINSLPFPKSTLWRMQKYIRRGFYMCAGEMQKLAAAIEGPAAEESPEQTGGNTEPGSEGSFSEGGPFVGMD